MSNRSCKIRHATLHISFINTFVYAKCRDNLRKLLSDIMMHTISITNEIPWCSVGDFNVIIASEEKLAGIIPYNMNKNFEFIGVIEACGLMNLGYND